MPDTLPRFSQENLIYLLTFDDKNYQLVRNSITPSLFDSPYKEVVEKIISYIDRYKQPPRDFIADEIDSYLQGDKGAQYRDILNSLLTLKNEGANLNSKYIVEQLAKFIRERRYEEALYDAAAANARGDLAEVSNIFKSALDLNLSLFDPGLKLTDLDILFNSLEEEEIFPTGIQAFTKMNVGLARGQVYLLIGKYASGKSWQAIQVGKLNALLNYKVAHITLEISKEIALQRYWQSILGLTRWRTGEVIRSPLFVRDGNKQFAKINQTLIQPRSLSDSDIKEYIESFITKLGPRIEQNVRIKSAPTGSLTVSELKSYLDMLEQSENFIPDLVVLDQASQMKVAGKTQQDLRVNLGRTFMDIRGLTVERNMALYTNHHMNREGAKSKVGTGTHVSEDWSIMGIVDVAAIYNQTAMEKKSNIARVTIDRARSMPSGFTALIAQNYNIGAFCLDSELLPEDYDPYFKEGAGFEEEYVNE